MEAIVYSYSLTNVTKFPTKMDKKMVRYKTLKYFVINIQYDKNGSRLQFIKFDLGTGYQEIKFAILVFQSLFQFHF